MAETLTFENNPEVTTMGNLNADEQDSLKVGEAMVEAQDELLAGKYKDAQELEKAYVELQKKLGDKGTGDSSEARNSEDSEEVESEEGSENEDEADVDTSKDGFLDQLWEAAIGDKDYSKETLEELSKMDAADIADIHLR